VAAKTQRHEEERIMNLLTAVIRERSHDDRGSICGGPA